MNFLEINLNNILYNIKALKKISGANKFCAVVKANAYGHGAEEVSLFIEKECDCFAVAVFKEGVALRSVGVQKDILVFSPPLSEEHVVWCVSHDLCVTAADEKSAWLIRDACKKYSVNARVHLKINSGMNRYGVSIDELKKMIEILDGCSRIEGIYSHFYDSKDEVKCDAQFSYFLKCVNLVEKTEGKVLLKHISATGGVILSDKYALDMVRVGLGLYGYLPVESDKVELKKAMKCYAYAEEAKEYKFGGCAYGENDGSGFLSAVHFGYADGLIKNYPLGVNGLCMDAYVTDKKCFHGQKICVMDDADKAAQYCGTINYDVLCSFSERVERIYV